MNNLDHKEQEIVAMLSELKQSNPEKYAEMLKELNAFHQDMNDKLKSYIESQKK